MPTITCYTFDGAGSVGANRVYDAVKNPGGGFAAELGSRLSAADSATWAWVPIDYGQTQILTAYEPFGAALARGVADATAKILATPGKIVLAAHAQGTLVTTTLYNEFRYGNLRSRRDDLIGIFTFGDVTRPQGWTTPLFGAKDPTGTGSMTLPLRQSYGNSATGLVNSPESLYWSFANVGDAAATSPSGVQPLMSQVIRRILYSGTESPDKIIFLYGEGGIPNVPPASPVALSDLTGWCAANAAAAQAKGLYKGQSLLDLIISLVGGSSVVSVSGIITLLSLWWPFTTPSGPWGFLRPVLPSYTFNPHVRYSGFYPYTSLANTSRTAVTLAYEYLLSLSKQYLPTAAPPINPKADRQYQLLTFGNTGVFYSSNGSRNSIGTDGCTADIGRSDIDYTQVGYGAEIARAIDPTRVEWVPVTYTCAAFPLRLPIQNAVNKAVRMILATPTTTKFFLAGDGIGTAVTSKLYEEFRSGRLQSRNRQLLGVYNFGNIYREQGAYRASTNPGGHGMAGSGYRITNTDPSIIWEFVNPGDSITSVESSTQTRWGSLLYDIMHFNVNHPNSLKSVMSEAVIRPSGSDPDLVSFTLDILNSLYGPSGKHNEYLDLYPFAGTKNCIRLAADNINAIVGVAPPKGTETETSEETGTVTPATRPTLMNTRTYMCVPGTQTSEDLSRVYAGIKRLNIDYIRVPVSWGNIQPNKNLLDTDRWSVTDDIINKALAANLQPMLVISPPIPTWTKTSATADIAAFVTNLVGRYCPGGGGISAANTGRGVLEYQIWDEPNAAETWPSYPSVSQYSEWLATLYPIIKEIQPSATVIFGGLQACNTSFPSGSSRPTNIDAVTFLRGCYDRGAKDFFDVMAYHPLSVSTRQIPRPQAPSARSIAEADRIRATMIAYGDGETPMYWTQIGYDTAVFSQLQQRDYLNTMRWFSQTRSWVKGLGIYTYRDA